MSTSPTEVLTIGNATIDAFLALHEASVHCRLDPSTCELCVKYGQKIPLDGCEFHVGGNASNVAVGLSRAGQSVSLLAELGEDEFAAKIVNTLTKEGIDLSHVSQKGTSSFAIGVQFQNERTLFVEHETREHNFSFDGLTPKLVYLTSIGNHWEGAYAKTLQFVKETKSLLACNPGTLQIQRGKESIEDVLTHAEIVFLNKEEAEKLFGLSEISLPAMLKKMRESIPGLLVMTNGKEGAYALTKEEVLYHIPVMECEVVEKTGAGDAFASGFLYGMLSKQSVQSCLQYGTLNAVGVMGEIGAQQGLLSASDYTEKLSQAPSVQQL